MIKTLAAEIKEYKLTSIATPLLMIGEVLCETLVPLLMASIVDEGINNGDLNHIYKMGGLMLVVACFGLLFGYLAGRWSSYAASGFAHNLREAMFANIQTFSFSNIDKFSTASLVTRLTTDVANIQNAYQMMLRMFVRAPASVIIAMLMAFYISPRLALIYLGATIFLLISLLSIMMFASKHFSAVFEKYDELNESVQENVSAMRVVKAYVREAYEQSKFKKACEGIYKLFMKAEAITSLTQPLMSLTVYVCILAVSWFGAHLIVQDELSTGQLMSLLTYCNQILMSLMMMGMIFVMVTMSRASVQRIAAVMEEKSDLSDPENPIMVIEDGSVNFKNVSFAYGSGGEVLKNLNFEVKSGETIGIIGMTGSGKSTLVSLISRLYDVKSGSVEVGGIDVRQYSLKALRDQVACVLQKNELFSGTIYDNLRWGDAQATDEECQQACEIAQASSFIEKFPDGYNTLISQGGNNVSGGQKQRLCIARAILKKPKIMILDDSTSAVDMATDAKMRKAFREYLRGMTKFIIAQRVSSVQDADRIMVLNEGEITGFDTHENLLLNNELYRSIYDSQTGSNGDFDEVGD